MKCDSCGGMHESRADAATCKMDKAARKDSQARADSAGSCRTAISEVKREMRDTERVIKDYDREIAQDQKEIEKIKSRIERTATAQGKADLREDIKDYQEDIVVVNSQKKVAQTTLKELSRILDLYEQAQAAYSRGDAKEAQRLEDKADELSI